MLEFVKKSFRGFFEFYLWLNLTLFTIIGGICGNILAGRGDSGGHIFAGLVVGAIIGLIADVIGGGLIATFLEMSEDIKKIAAGNVPEGLHGGKPIEKGIKSASDINVNQSDPPKDLPAINTTHTVVKEMKLYKKQGNFDTVVCMLKPNETVSVVGRDGTMCNVKTINGDEGWCFSGDLKQKA
jgi:hypothetical protein